MRTRFTKMFQIKVIENWISYEKVNERTSLCPPVVELQGSKDWCVWNIIMYWNGKVYFRTIWYLKHIKLSNPQAPLLGEIGMYIHIYFCTKFNAQQLLFEAFSDITYLRTHRQYVNMAKYQLLVFWFSDITDQ